MQADFGQCCQYFAAVNIYFPWPTPGAQRLYHDLAGSLEAHLREDGQMPVHSWPGSCPKTHGCQTMMSFDDLHNAVTVIERTGNYTLQ